MKSTKGITLIALVVTIIVVLILAGISIAMLTGENGIINNAKEARIANEAGTVDEQVKLATTVLNLEITKNRTKYSSYNATNFIDTATDGNITVEKSLVDILENELTDTKYTITPGASEITVAYNSPTYNKTYTIAVTKKLAKLGATASGEDEEDGDINIQFAITGTKLNTANLSTLATISALPTVTAGTKATTKSRYTDSDNNIAIIPAGATVSTVSGEQNVNTGLVIKDDDGNEFVWIPVDIDQSLSLKVTSKETITDITLLDPRGDEISVGSYSGTEYPKTNLTPTLNGEYEVKVTAGETEESKTLVVRSLYAMDGFADAMASDERIAEVAEENSVTVEEVLSQSGVSSGPELRRMITRERANLGTETENYITSVNTNGGFYVGRYEAGNDSGTLVSKANVAVYNNVTRDQAKALADGMYSGVSHLLTDSAWDRTLGFLINTNNKTLSQVAVDSKDWGNYSDSSISGTGGLANTAAFGTDTRANNIYDLAGNVCEWTSTTAPYSEDLCICRRRSLHRFRFWGSCERSWLR